MVKTSRVILINDDLNLEPTIIKTIRALQMEPVIITATSNDRLDNTNRLTCDFENREQIKEKILTAFANYEISHVILSLKPPKLSASLIENSDLSSMHEAILRFNTHVKTIVAGFKDKQVKLIVNLAFDHLDPLKNVIFNNYVLGFLQGLRIEMKPYLPQIHACYYQENDYFYESVLKKLLSLRKAMKLISNLPKNIYYLQVLNKKPIIKNNNTRIARVAKPVAIITGASGGIGYEIAKILAQNNWTVYSLSRKAKESTLITYLECDITNDQLVASCFQKIFEQHRSIDLVINNSGYGISGALAMMDETKFNQMLEVNLIAALKIIKTAIPYLKKTSGRIFNIGSVAGTFAIPFQCGYALTKTLIDAYTEMLMPVLNKENIQICNIMPGYTRTNFSNTRAQHTNYHGEDKYAKRVKASITKMEKEEKQHGPSPTVVAKVLCQQLKKRNMLIKTAVGSKYKFLTFLARLLPMGIIATLLYLLYAKNEI